MLAEDRYWCIVNWYYCADDVWAGTTGECIGKRFYDDWRRCHDVDCLSSTTTYQVQHLSVCYHIYHQYRSQMSRLPPIQVPESLEVGKLSVCGRRSPSVLPDLWSCRCHTRRWYCPLGRSTTSLTTSSSPIWRMPSCTAKMTASILAFRWRGRVGTLVYN